MFIYTMYFSVTAVFNDGRFGLSLYHSLFQNFSCINKPSALSLTECVLMDRCQTNCLYPTGVCCYGKTYILIGIFKFFIHLESAGCNEGEVRLVNGSSDQSGRLEVCTDQTWGCVCGTGFDVTDAYVVCRELGLGISGTNVVAIKCFKDFF